MELKKNPKADMRNRRILFFEAGLVAALVAIIVTFNTNHEKENEGFPAFSDAVADPDWAPEAVKKEPKPVVVSERVVLNPEFFKVVKNDAKISAVFEIPEDLYAGLPMPVLLPEVIDEEMPFVTAEIMPTFQGGDLNSFRNWVMQKLRYPAMAVDIGLEGKVVLSFVIEKDGTLSNVEVLVTPDRVLSDEAVRVVSQSPEWTPAYMGKNPVRLKYTLPVDFKITR